LKRVVVSRRPINRGTTVKNGDLALEEREFNNENALGTVDLACLVGNQARRFIPRGHLVATRDVKPLPLVNRNDLVDVYVVFGQHQMKTVAKAMEPGSYGETIQVKSTSTGERFFVTVTGPGTTKLGDPPRKSGKGLKRLAKVEQ
jgi:flagella basal body P-ring formation protein FlgA